MQFKFLLVAIILLITQAFAHEKRTLISFKSKSCEALALDYHFTMFSLEDAPKFYKYLGILSVKTEVYKLMTIMRTKSEFHECVEHVEPSQEIKIDDPVVIIPTDEERKYWQLRRINVNKLPLPKKFHRFEVKGVLSHVYIIDSGIDGHHNDFKGRLAPTSQHKTFVSDICSCKNEGALCDCNGHGTHCAGLVGSPEAGYNPNTTLHSAKVFSASGSTTADIVLEAMNWAIEAKKTFHPNEVTVVSMSLGGGYSSIENQAVQKIHEAGMFITVAAGNSNKDSCTGSPS